MTKSIVGYSGFVGSNIARKTTFDALYNSKNISEAYDTSPDLLVYAGLPAEKYLANNAPDKDLEKCKEAFENINKIKAKKTVLISTVDIYKTPCDVDENSEIITDGLHPYGLNRYYLEEWVSNYDSLIVRLPALFGLGLKKNFIYDIIHIVPQMLTVTKMDELSLESNIIKESYEKMNDTFYKLKELSGGTLEVLKNEFLRIGFSALNFTDSQSVFQFYNLAYLWEHIQKALNSDIKVLNIATEPLSAQELYESVFKKEFSNVLSDSPPMYNYKTIHAALFHGKNGYLFSKQQVMSDIASFIEGQ